MLSHRNPLGYRSLRTWQQANEILELTEKFIFKGLNTPQLAAGMKAHLKKELAHRDAPRLAAGQFTITLPDKHSLTGQSLVDLKDHMLRSARSLVRNIEEGYARTTTKEYIAFLGFSAGSLEELIGDYKYCQRWNIGDSKVRSKGIGICVGEAKMLDSQIKSLEAKTYREKTVTSNDLARKVLEERKKRDEDFDKWLDQYRHK